VRKSRCGFALLAISLVLLTLSGVLIAQAVTEREICYYTQTWYEVDVGELHVVASNDTLTVFLRSFIDAFYHVRLSVDWAEEWRTLACMPLHEGETLNITLMVAEIWHLFGYDKPMPVYGRIYLHISYYMWPGDGYHVANIGWAECGKIHLRGLEATLRGEVPRTEEAVMRARRLELLWVATPLCLLSIIGIYTALRSLREKGPEGW